MKIPLMSFPLDSQTLSFYSNNDCILSMISYCLSPTRFTSHLTQLPTATPFLNLLPPHSQSKSRSFPIPISTQAHPDLVATSHICYLIPIQTSNRTPFHSKSNANFHSSPAQIQPCSRFNLSPTLLLP